MADDPELPPPEDQSSSDDETVKGDLEEGHVVDILEEERQAAGTPVQQIGNGSISHLYRDIIEAEAGTDTASENGSIDDIPRRAGSPIDSLLSVPGYSPSIQVWTMDSVMLVSRDDAKLAIYIGFGNIIPKQQRPPFRCIQTRLEQPDPVLQTLRPQIPIANILSQHPLSAPFIACVPSGPQQKRVSEQPITARCRRNRHPVSTMGSRAMDETQEVKRTGILRGWQEELRVAHLYGHFRVDRPRNIEGDNLTV